MEIRFAAAVAVTACVALVAGASGRAVRYPDSCSLVTQVEVKAAFGGTVYPPRPLGRGCVVGVRGSNRIALAAHLPLTGGVGVLVARFPLPKTQIASDEAYYGQLLAKAGPSGCSGIGSGRGCRIPGAKYAAFYYVQDEQAQILDGTFYIQVSDTLSPDDMDTMPAPARDAYLASERTAVTTLAEAILRHLKRG
jgi:hypothetical protein